MNEQAGIVQESRNIHHLPAELLHMICVYLKPLEIAGIRLLDRNIAAVGLEYLVSQIHLIPTADSFDRLLALAEHPIANRSVTSLFYEADLLKSRRLLQVDRDEWEKSTIGSGFIGTLKEVHDPDFASACGLLPRRYVRGPPVSVRKRQTHYTKRELQQGFHKYRSYYGEQRRINESVIYQESLVRAFKRLPNLTVLIISCNRGTTSHFRDALKAGLSEDVTPDLGFGNQLGASQVAFLLSAADKAGLRITKLVCGSLGQCVLRRSLERRDAITRGIRNLRILDLFLSHVSGTPDAIAVPNPLGISSKLSVVNDFAASAPNLETLSIRFDQDRPIDPPDLKHFLVDSQWSCLRSATFAKMSTSLGTLVGFCGRHASTLRDLTLADINLYSGRWSSIFLELRQRLELNKMDISGVIQSYEGEFWTLDTDWLMKVMIQYYILHSDDRERNLPFRQRHLIYDQCMASRRLRLAVSPRQGSRRCLIYTSSVSSQDQHTTPGPF